MRFKKNPDSGDPSLIPQSFEKVDMNVHCCRYWWMKRWSHRRLSFPYWRLYWNKVPGAYVFFEKRVDLDPGHIILIPPYTPFYTGIGSDELASDESYCMEGGWIQNPEMELLSIEKGYIPHFFIHFNLGYHYDNVKPGIYPVVPDSTQKQLLSSLTDNLMQGNSSFAINHSLALYNLILLAVKEIPLNSWEEFSVGVKIQKAINHINRNLSGHLTNDELAWKVQMAPNSFARLFKQQTGNTPQEFIREKRVEHASKLLYHTDQSIKQISVECGFNDRYYFTRVFNRIMGVPPARYRKSFMLVKV